MARKLKTEGTGSSEMYLYGIIGRGMDIDVYDLIKSIEDKRKEGITDFTFYVNSDGGEVTQGSALFNYLDRTDIKVTWVVDGIAASMMAVLITNPKHTVKAAKHAKFMYHRVCGYTYGNSDETRAAADMIESFESTLIEIMSNRIGCSAEETKAKYFNGVDHWLSAEQALKAGLCDEITNHNQGMKELMNITTTRDAFNFYNNQIINLKKSKTMEKANDFATVLNISETGASEGTILENVKRVVNERNSLSSQLAAEKAKREELEKKVQEFEKGKVTNLIDKAIADKRIGEDERETYTTLAEKDFASTEKILNRMKPVKRIVDQFTDQPVPEIEKDWDFNKYHKEGKLENLKNNNPDHYKKVFKDEFGVDPKNI